VLFGFWTPLLAMAHQPHMVFYLTIEVNLAGPHLGCIGHASTSQVKFKLWSLYQSFFTFVKSAGIEFDMLKSDIANYIQFPLCQTYCGSIHPCTHLAIHTSILPSLPPASIHHSLYMNQDISG
jgi:hypothetical protein